MQQQQPISSDEFFGAPRQVWIIAGGLALTLIIAVLGYSVWDKTHELQRTRAEADALRAGIASGEAAANALKEKLAQSEACIGELQKDKENTVQTHKSLEGELRAALESKDVTISQLQGKLTVNILDRILFESGESVLKTDGEVVLRKIAAILVQHPNLKVHVIGHTDNVPIRPGSKSRYASNWDLSAGRAIAAVRFLTEKGGVDPRRLGAVGYGEFRPIADNSTSAGRARNRRIAITVLSEEMVGSDALPVSSTVTNAPTETPIEAPAADQTTPPKD